jgi:hypothetical protein
MKTSRRPSRSTQRRRCNANVPSVPEHRTRRPAEERRCQAPGVARIRSENRSHRPESGTPKIDSESKFIAGGSGKCGIRTNGSDALGTGLREAAGRQTDRASELLEDLGHLGRCGAGSQALRTLGSGTTTSSNGGDAHRAENAPGVLTQRVSQRAAPYRPTAPWSTDAG